MDKMHFGNSIGIIGGDSAYFLGLNVYYNTNFDQAKNLQAINYYKEAFFDLCDGILIEIAMVNRPKLTINDYIKMISLKTGALIEKSMLIGANYAGASKEQLALLSSYGVNLGIIFQITDDILGTFGDEKVTGKPVDGDIREGKKTCLLIHALDILPQHKRDRINKLIGNEKITEEEVKEVRDLFLEADVISYCKELSRKYELLARDDLDKLSPAIDPSELEFYNNLLKYVLEREF